LKIGMRKPSVSKSLKARTTGKVTRAIKSSVNPTYGEKGMGYLNDPKRAVKNAVYNKTTSSMAPRSTSSSRSTSNSTSGSSSTDVGCTVVSIVAGLLLFFFVILPIIRIFE